MGQPNPWTTLRPVTARSGDVSSTGNTPSWGTLPLKREQMLSVQLLLAPTRSENGAIRARYVVLLLLWDYSDTAIICTLLLLYSCVFVFMFCCQPVGKISISVFVIVNWKTLLSSIGCDYLSCQACIRPRCIINTPRNGQRATLIFARLFTKNWFFDSFIPGALTLLVWSAGSALGPWNLRSLSCRMQIKVAIR